MCVGWGGGGGGGGAVDGQESIESLVSTTCSVLILYRLAPLQFSGHLHLYKFLSSTSSDVRSVPPHATPPPPPPRLHRTLTLLTDPSRHGCRLGEILKPPSVIVCFFGGGPSACPSLLSCLPGARSRNEHVPQSFTRPLGKLSPLSPSRCLSLSPSLFLSVRLSVSLCLCLSLSLCAVTF